MQFPEKNSVKYLVIQNINTTFVLEIIAWHYEAKSSQKEDPQFGTNSYQLNLQRLQRIDK